MMYAAGFEVCGGRWGDGAKELLNVCAHFALESGRATVSGFKKHWGQRLSTSLQRAAVRKLKFIYEASVFSASPHRERGEPAISY